MLLFRYMTLHKFKMITKPFWIPTITAIYYFSADEINPYVISALIFGWIGDLLLMRGKKSWFITGASSFMIGHFFYIYVFIRQAGDLQVFLEHPVFTAIALMPYIGYLVFLKKFLGHNISSIFYAAAAYISILALMSYTALLRVWNVSTGSFLLTYTGSIMFIASDTLITIRNFKRKFKGIGTIIVVTYIAAQLLIIGGLIHN